MNEDQSPDRELSPRVIASRENARKGGAATAAKYSAEWRKERARKGGETLRTLYSVDYYRHINQQRKSRNGWPLGKMRKAREKAEQAIAALNLSPAAQQVVNSMLALNAK